MRTQTIQALIATTAEKLCASGTPKLDAEILLAHLLEQPRAYLYSHLETEISGSLLDAFEALVHRRSAGEPVAYITGKREFWDLELAVTPDVLVPRPETELLVESAFELFAEDSRAFVADLGTGSGAIAIALGKHRHGWRIAAVDESAAALRVAKANAHQHNLWHIEFIQSSWCDDLPVGALDMIVANPPYVAPGDPHLQSTELQHEPLGALQAEEDGFADLFAIASSARDHLKPRGWLLLEHGFEQQQALCEKLQELGYVNVSGRKDLSGQERMVLAQIPQDPLTQLTN